jgi:hypothetical protein
MKKDPENAGLELLFVIGNKIELFEMLKRLEYQDLYEDEARNPHDRIEEIIDYLKALDPLDAQTRADLTKLELTMGQVLLRAFFSQGVDKIKQKVGKKTLSQLQAVYSTEDLFSFLKEEKKRSRDGLDQKAAMAHKHQALENPS